MNDQLGGASQHYPGAIKVIGIGQSLRGDDAAGLAAVRLWLATYPANANRSAVQVEMAELPGISLLDLLQGVTVAILVDALHSGAQPGSIHILSQEQLESFQSGAGSAHGLGIAEALSLGRQLVPGGLPEKLVLIGIEAGQFDLGEALSPPVQAALPEAAKKIEQLVDQALEDR